MTLPDQLTITLTAETLTKARAAVEQAAVPFNTICLLAQGGKDALSGDVAVTCGFTNVIVEGTNVYYQAQEESGKVATLVRLFDRGRDEEILAQLPFTFTAMRQE